VASDGLKRILDIEPNELHQRTAVTLVQWKWYRWCSVCYPKKQLNAKGLKLK
jgi:hypothetical protein